MTHPVTPVAALLADLAARGVELAADGDRLRYRPRATVPASVADRLRAHKDQLVALLNMRSATELSTAELAVLAEVPSPARALPSIAAAKAAFADLGGVTLVAFEPEWSACDLPADWREIYEERAGIMEFDGDLPREQAEVLALRDIRALMEGAVRPLAPGMLPVGER